LLLLLLLLLLRPTNKSFFGDNVAANRQGQYNSVDEVTCRTQADAMVEKGLVAAGYNVFIVDEPCFAGRDASGELIANSTTWPSGFAAFGKYLADRGMQLGIYTDAGPYTCQGCPASAGHEEQDMATFISWGASYVKVDRKSFFYSTIGL
jgi:alpha-galactosidase